MRRGARLPAVVIAFVGIAAVAFPATAGAASKWQAVVVAKDPARKAIVTALPSGLVRTVRLSGGLGSLSVGQRVSVSAGALADGTFRGQRIQRVGRAGKVRIRGVLVRRQRSLARYLVSAGGSVLAIRSALRTTASVSSDGPRPGDQVVIDAALAGGTPTATNVQTVGHVRVLELEGIFLGLASNGALRLAVAHRGEVVVSVPAGTAPAGLRVGDVIQVDVSVDAAGAFTLVQSQADDEAASEAADADEDGGDTEDADDLEEGDDPEDEDHDEEEDDD